MLHFLFGGALLFAAYAWLDERSQDDVRGEGVVHITAAEVDWLRQAWERQWQRPPGDDELKGLVASYLEEELLAREAKALGLDVGDTIVRRRLAQKLEFLLKDTARIAEPTEDDLRRYYEAHPDYFRTEARVSFEHVYFSPDRRADAAADARAALVELARPGVEPGELGDRLLIEPEFHLADKPAVDAQFGPGFADALMALEPAAWSGPIESGFGLHLVHVSEVRPAESRDFNEVRPQVEERWREEREREARAQYLAALLEKYDVVVDDSVKPLVVPDLMSAEAGR